MDISNTSSAGEADQKITEPPRLHCNDFEGKRPCCIFRVLHNLNEINGKAYKPNIVSIGPYHRGQPQFAMIEEHKWHYLVSLLSRTKTKGLDLEDYLKAIAEVELEHRECYSTTSTSAPTNSSKCCDLLQLKNQIPFFVLNRLFELSKLPEDEESDTTLQLLALQCFNHGMRREEEVIEKHRNLQGMHVLDLVRSSFIPPEYEERHMKNTKTHIIHCVSKPRRAGINLKQGKADSFLVVKFRHGVIEMPTITIDNFMGSILLNCVAYEQCHRSCTNHFTTLTTLLDCLVNTWRDFEYLFDQIVIKNSTGNHAELTRFMNKLGKQVAFDIDKCYLFKLFNDVND